jgi:hypothetical protein
MGKLDLYKYWMSDKYSKFSMSNVFVAPPKIFYCTFINDNEHNATNLEHIYDFYLRGQISSDLHRTEATVGIGVTGGTTRSVRLSIL